MVETRGKTQEKVTLVVRPRGKPIRTLPEEVTIASSGPTTAIYEQLAEKAAISPHRLRVTKGSDGTLIPNKTDITVDTTGLRPQSSIYVKDLGPQIQWQTTFIIEYLGPLIIHPIAYLLFSWPDPSYLQTLTLALVMIHFSKRELETLFIHRFSAATMPMFNVVKNSAHYWILSGLNMAYWIYSPSAAAAKPSNPIITYSGLALFAFGELGNFSNHLTLRDLRSSGGSERGIPKGLGFDLVTCPNYMFEVMAWTGVILVSWSWSTVLFAIVAIIPMGIWAKKKEARYRKEFGAKYQRKTYGCLPGIW